MMSGVTGPISKHCWCTGPQEDETRIREIPPVDPRISMLPSEGRRGFGSFVNYEGLGH